METTLNGEGLRERKRRITRARIAGSAMALFTQRGFDRVSVAEIAKAAEVAEKTVYNYFPSKAELFFDEGEDLLTELLHAVATRPEGEPALVAVRRFIASLPEWAAHRRPVRPGEQFRSMIEASPALQAHRRAMFARYETELATLLAGQTNCPPGAAEPFVAAVALVGVLRAAFEATTSDQATHQQNTDHCLDLLAGGLDRYAPGGGTP
ncbi:MAG: TetR/AcrR family transcriptional regulator [Actinomycetota bacterium]|nr:TetR/AcrR family transcriptional regulator [Actinomycetota bacterium]